MILKYIVEVNPPGLQPVHGWSECLLGGGLFRLEEGREKWKILKEREGLPAGVLG